MVGPVEQPGLADPAKRAAQHGRQRQIVGGLEQVFGQHDQVANRDFLVQLEPVGPGHAHAPGLEPLGQVLMNGPERDRIRIMMSSGRIGR